MKIKKTYLILFVLIVCTFFTQSCFLLPGDRYHPSSAYEFEGYEKAKVINYPIDGCGWMLQLEDSTKLQPLILSPEFQKEGLQVLIKYEIKKDVAGVCMAGKIVALTDIKKLK
ncbi:MAG: hypothetical protein ACXVPU_10110 [Bacteroidia bacterium]